MEHKLTELPSYVVAWEGDDRKDAQSLSALHTTLHSLQEIYMLQFRGMSY